MSKNGKQRALIAMSGGVDSSVAALLAQRNGYECTGVTMKLITDDCTVRRIYSHCNQPDEAADVERIDNIVSIDKAHIHNHNHNLGGASLGVMNTGRPCSLSSGAADAADVAASLGIPHQVIDFTSEFRTDVIEPFISAYEAGATPNPCVDCNVKIKFGRLYEYARAMGFDKVVTGHYARIIQESDVTTECYTQIMQRPGRVNRLARATDTGKDQSYFLYGIEREKLAHILFPLGELTKEETRDIAREAGLINAKRRESQDICFIRGGHADFIESYRGKPSVPGNFIDINGKILGRHSGIIRYTIGQRKGLGVALKRPVFVKEIRQETNEVVLADDEGVYASQIEITDVNWQLSDFDNTAVQRGAFFTRQAVSDEGGKTHFDEYEEAQAMSGMEARRAGAAQLRAQVIIRHRAKPVWATISTAQGGRLTAVFDEPIRAPAKGQAAVLYDGDLVIGGGRIS